MRVRRHPSGPKSRPHAARSTYGRGRNAAHTGKARPGSPRGGFRSGMSATLPDVPGATPPDRVMYTSKEAGKNRVTVFRLAGVA